MANSTRPQRWRRTEGLRQLVREASLASEQIVLPVFALPGRGREEPVSSLPNAIRCSPDMLAARAEGWRSGAVLAFGVPDERDPLGSSASDENGPVARAVRAIKTERPDLPVMTDVCLCAYTPHGQCAVLTKDGRLDADATLAALGRMAVTHAAAGADVVAPSAMQDGQVRVVREALDAGGFGDALILSYAAKFASAFYGPFRDAARTAPAHGDRRWHQLPLSNRREALRDALLDEDEGADALMVKPALPYLDVLCELRRETRLPLFAYQVSGECAMIRHAAAAGALDEREGVMEALVGIRRAGADAIITYYAEEACRWLNG